MYKDAEDWFLIIVSACDLDAARELVVPAGLLVLDAEAKFMLEDTEVVPEALTARIIGSMALSELGHNALNRMAHGWTGKTGSPLPILIDLSKVSGQQKKLQSALRHVGQLYRTKMTGFAEHNAELLRQMAVMRMAQEECNASLEAMELFLLRSVETQRWQVQNHAPLGSGQGSPLNLSSGTELRQRLSSSSAGLSDLAFLLTEQEIPVNGRLTATLHLLESDHIAAQWVLSAADLTTGWQRLSLVRALGQDEQTPFLTLKWHGERDLRIARSLHHPDPDYCLELNGEKHDRLLAHRLWKYLPGSLAPMPESSHWIGGEIPSRFYVEPARLASAVSVDPNVNCLQYFAVLKALQVHPFKNTVSAGRIAKAVPASVRQISSTIGGRSEKGPPIEYALATAPLHPVREIGDLVMQCERDGRISDWMLLSGDTQGEITLYLRAPTEEISDLYLLTRLAPGAQQQYGWATFRNIWLSV